MESIVEIKRRICDAGRKGIDILIGVIEEPILNNSDDSDDISADKITRAAQAKKIAFMDSLEMLSRVEAEEALLSHTDDPTAKPIPRSFAEDRAKSSK